MRLLVQICARGSLIAYRRLPACQPAQRDLVVPQQTTLAAPRDPQRRRDVLLTVMKLDSPNSQRDRRFAASYHIVAPLKHNARLLSWELTLGKSREDATDSSLSLSRQLSLRSRRPSNRAPASLMSQVPPYQNRMEAKKLGFAHQRVSGRSARWLFATWRYNGSARSCYQRAFVMPNDTEIQSYENTRSIVAAQRAYRVHLITFVYRVLSYLDSVRYLIPYKLCMGGMSRQFSTHWNFTYMFTLKRCWKREVLQQRCLQRPSSSGPMIHCLLGRYRSK